MTVQRDTIVVVDIEATCWSGEPPPGQINEIIEVGACLLQVEDIRAPHIIEKRSILVRPVKSTVSAFCTELTTLTQAQVDSGVSFAEACAILVNEYATPSRLWVSWGNYDQEMFEAQCKSFDVPYPFSAYHANIRRIFGKYAPKDKDRNGGMANALKVLGLEAEGTAHRGDDDAWNIARILAVMLQTHGGKILSKYW